MRRVLAFILLSTLSLAADDESAFDTPPPGSWQQVSPLAPLFPAAFDFSGGQCRITCPTPTPEIRNTYGGARGGLFAPTSMLDSAASVDITAWDPSDNRNDDGIHMFVFTRVQGAIGLGSITGYAASIIDMGANSGPEPGTRNGRLQIMLIYQEQLITNFNQYADFPFDETHDYRLILISRGNRHVARVFDLANPSLPLAELIVQDANIPAPGRTGILIYNDKLAPLDVTFDNFLAWDGTPPPLTIQHGIAPGTIDVRCDFLRSFASSSQTTTDPSLPNNWFSTSPTGTARSGNLWVETYAMDGPRRFFRRTTP